MKTFDNFRNKKIISFLSLLLFLLIVSFFYLGNLENKIEEKNYSNEVTTCLEVYKPVCAQVEIQCVKAPCKALHQTFSNSCFAKKHKILYEGECR